jgi:alpha-galactosidase
MNYFKPISLLCLGIAGDECRRPRFAVASTLPKGFVKSACLALLLLVGLAALAGTNDFPILTPPPPSAPRINGPAVYGARPGHPFLYRIPCTGERPLKFSAKHLPKTLVLDMATGIITGTTPVKGEYVVTIQAANAAGHAERKFKIVAGDQLALTPPMGWNSWYVHFNRVDDQALRTAATAMVASGLADAGYQYVNIDDCWMNAEETRKYMPDATRVGPLRDGDGNILPNRHFPDMKALTDFIHALGLKAGIYSSPGPNTCCGLSGSWQHEGQDAARFSAWGFDFLKYDWCSYNRIAGKQPSLAEMQKPYRVMGEALRRQPRDLVFNLCQYGMGNVWEWGADVGGQCWRTAGDLGFELDRFFGVALKNAEHGAWSKPGAWNDPDYLQIGWIGSQRGTNFTLPKPCPLSADEQYSYMSLWCLMAAPLFFSGDMERLDAFTLNVLGNSEVIAVDQDALGQSARVVKLAGRTFAMVKDLADGSKAVGLFNPEETPAVVTASWTDLGLHGRYAARDLWRQQDLGKIQNASAQKLPRHGVFLMRLTR